MSVRYQPTLAIDGRPIAGTTLGDGLLPLAGLTIDWGQDDIYSPTKPATATVYVADEDGGWSAETRLVGATMAITRAPGVVVFRGTIGSAELAATTVQDDNGVKHDIYVTKIVATCPLAYLDMAVLPGTGISGSAVEAYYGVGFWDTKQAGGPSGAGASYATGGSQGGALRYVDSVEWVPTIVPEVSLAYNANVRRYATSEAMSLGELLRRYYSLVPLAHVVYNPATHGIEIGRPATTPGAQLVLVAGVIEIVPLAGYPIPAGALIVDKGAPLLSTAGNAIDLVAVSYQEGGTSGGTDSFGVAYRSPKIVEQIAYARTATSRGDKTLSIASPLPSIASSPGYHNLLATAIAAAVDGINNKFTHPDVIYDFRRFVSGDAGLDVLLLDTKSRSTALLFPASKFNHLPNVSPFYQVIGGTLAWNAQQSGSQLEAGWTQRMRLAPTTGTPNAVDYLTWMTNTTVDATNLDPIISAADMAAVTVGLP